MTDRVESPPARAAAAGRADVAPASIAAPARVPGAPDPMLEVQRAILDELRAIHATLRRQAPAPLFDRFACATHALLGDEPFTAPSLLALANSSLSTRLELRAAVDDIVRDVNARGAGRRFGRFLAANTQRTADGRMLVFVGKTRDGGVYRVVVETKTRTSWNFGT